MMVVAGTACQLPSGLEVSLAAYRHSVFVEALGWQLPVEGWLERDQFDRDDTVYVVAQGERGEVCGCARLLPTTKAYLLGDVFPEMMNGSPLPHDPQIWELSRFATMPVGDSQVVSREDARARFCTLFAAMVEVASAHGASRLITVTALGVERILRSIGIHAHRVGPPRIVDGKPTLAMWIELDSQTHQALGLRAASDVSVRQ